MVNFNLFRCNIVIFLCFTIFYLTGCTTLKYTSPVVIKDGEKLGGETFELKKRFVLTKVTGFKVKKDRNGIVEASFDTVENTEAKAVEALADFAKTAMNTVGKFP